LLIKTYRPDCLPGLFRMSLSYDTDRLQWWSVPKEQHPVQPWPRWPTLTKGKKRRCHFDNYSWALKSWRTASWVRRWLRSRTFHWWRSQWNTWKLRRSYSSQSKSRTIRRLCTLSRCRWNCWDRTNSNFSSNLSRQHRNKYSFHSNNNHKHTLCPRSIKRYNWHFRGGLSKGNLSQRKHYLKLSQ
jgi:hypothetical protein